MADGESESERMHARADRLLDVQADVTDAAVPLIVTYQFRYNPNLTY